MQQLRLMPMAATAILAALAVCEPGLAQQGPCDLAINGVRFEFDRDNPIAVYELEESGLKFRGDFKAKFQGTCVGIPPEFRGCSFCASFYFQQQFNSGAPFQTILKKVEVLTYECTATSMPLELELEINAEDISFLNPTKFRLFAAARPAPCNLDPEGNPMGPPMKSHMEEFPFIYP